MKRRAKTRRAGGGAVLWAAAALFALVAAITGGGVGRLAGASDAEGVAAVRGAIERAAVLCYATEGFYPPGLAYMEDYYGVVIDKTRYAVNYEVFAANVMPVIRVSGR